MAWTEQQQNAIAARNSSVIVSAAAGSGKTAVLTERLAQLISQPEANVRADRIIAVTFTNDAASELKKRLNLKLKELINKNPNNGYLLKQQTLLQSAKIATINSFCFDLLRDNINEQGITSGFSVLDESENKILQIQAMDELINQYCKDEYDKISFLYDKFCLKDDENLAEVISSVDKFLSSVAFRNKWIDQAVKNYKTNPYESVYSSILFQTAISKLNVALKTATDCLKMLDDIFSEYSYEKNNVAEKSLFQTQDDIKRIETALNIFKNSKIPSDAEITYCSSFERLITVRKSEPVDAELRECYKIKRKSYIEVVKEIIHLFDNFENDFYENKEVLNILAELLKDYQNIIWRKKCEKNAISFDDGERLVLELFASNDKSDNIIQSDVAIKISELYDIIMIDEYQDSNNKQDLIFKLISRNYHIDEKGIPAYGDNVFLVGDVKQSIYKFRLANPKNFINTLKNSVPYSIESNSSNFSISLNKNFRSSMEVINFVNYMFEQIMSESCGDIDYNNNEKLYFGAEEYNEHCVHEKCTNIALINTDIDDEQNENITEKSNLEAVYTANKIADMINNGAMVQLKDGELRKCEPQDFCILIRKNKYTKLYVSELNKRGIYAKGEEETGYLASREIAVLLDVLRVIDNPLLDIPLAAIMMSPMFMFELEELAFLKTLNKNEHLFTIITDLVNNKYAECTDIFFIERCRELLSSLNEFRLYAVTMTIGELIRKIYDTTDFISVMQLYTDGEKKRANLRALIQYAKNYENSVSFEGSGGLSGFVRYIDRIIENGTDFKQGKISSSSGNYVSVKTIHKSKGLEYPFVFLAETTARFQFDSPIVACSDDGRIGFILHDNKLVRRYRTLPYKQIIEENTRDIISEEMRLLYVALTRAKQQLFINLKCGEKYLKNVSKLIDEYYLNNENISQLAVNAKSFSDWIWMILLEHKKFHELADEIGIHSKSFEFPPYKFKDEMFSFEYINNDDNNLQSDISDILDDNEADVNKAICDELKNIINFKYDKTLSETPAKMSVTQITKKFKGESDNFDFKLKRPRFIQQDTKLTGAEKGTAIHTFFQYCNFDSAEKNAQNEIERMIDKGYLSVAQAESISLENTRAFFDNNLYSRIKGADKIWREKKFMVAIAELNIENSLMNIFKKSNGMIKGIVDLIFEENEELIIVDYKSDRGISPERLSERYKVQLSLYKSAVELTMNKKVSECYLYSFELKTAIEINL